ncbi:CHAT domain-containing protein [Desulfobacterales bacterium HSG16]|nr:CHAT domain-containing protein [Desulfobacterales bacterium HSG16]
MRPTIRYEDGKIHALYDEINLDESREITEDDLKLFDQWIETYRIAIGKPDSAEKLLDMGMKIYSWLNGTNGCMEKILDARVSMPLLVEFAVCARPKAFDLSFLEIPWEILADKNGFLAKDQFLVYSPVRRIGNRKDSVKPSEYRLAALFMAAEPRNGDSHLKYEEEESSLLDATGDVGMDLVVEESGNPGLLAECLAREKNIDLLHISCHGISRPKPLLSLEDEFGNAFHAQPKDLWKAVGSSKPRLLFLSACQTSEPGSLVNSFSSDMIQYGLPGVLGWGGSVKDDEASKFAGELYKFLSLKNDIENSVAMARHALLSPNENAVDKKPSRDWHLARLYLGQTGGGILCESQKKRRLSLPERGHKEFLDIGKAVPVAGMRQFVGRRRQIQSILKQFRTFDMAGVLIHGLGRQGKSSLAARIANRRHDLKVVVIYGNYDAASILKAIENTVLDQKVGDVTRQYIPEVRNDPGQLKFVLRSLIEKTLQDVTPVLLVIDDFEQILKAPVDSSSLHCVKSGYVDAISAVIQAFDGAETDSRLLITSRYKFSVLSDQGSDLGKKLFALDLPGMKDFESRKQAAAKEKYGDGLKQQQGNKNKAKQTDPTDKNRTRRCISAARGNPGLQDLLFSVSLEAPDACDTMLAEMESYIKSGEIPEGEKLLEFIKNLAIDGLIKLLSQGEKDLLRISTLFSMPVPEETMGILAEMLDAKKDGVFGQRLFSLGLWEVYEDVVFSENSAVAVNLLVLSEVEHMLGGLTDKEREALVTKELVCDLFERWGGEDESRRPGIVDYELARLALPVKNADILLPTAKNAVQWLDDQQESIAAAILAEKSIEILDDAGKDVPLWLLMKAYDQLDQTGKTEKAASYIERAIHIQKDKKKKGDNTEDFDLASVFLRYGKVLNNSGKPDKAINAFEEAKTLFKSGGFHRDQSIAIGDIARIRVSKGEVDEALKLHEERQKVFEELGDRRERAVTLGDIARIRVDKGEVDEALKLQNERLYVNRELGDLDGVGAALFDIARIEMQEEKYQEAFEHLSESYSLFMRIGRLDFICFVGLDLGKLLCQAGQSEQGIEILERSKQGFMQLGQKPYADHVEAMIAQFSKN